MKNTDSFHFNEFSIKTTKSIYSYAIETDNGHLMTAKFKGFIKTTIHICNNKTNEVVCVIKPKNFLETYADVGIIDNGKLKSMAKIHIKNQGITNFPGVLLSVEDHNNNQMTLKSAPILQQMFAGLPSKVMKHPVLFNNIDYGFVGQSGWRNKYSCFFEVFDWHKEIEKMPFMGLFFLAGVLWGVRHRFFLHLGG